MNGDVVTMSESCRSASAFIIESGRFKAVGSNEEMLVRSEPGCTITDLWGRAVLPGFIETHSHLSLHAMVSLQLDCSFPLNPGIKDIISGVRNRAGNIRPGQWIRGWGFDNTRVAERRHLTRHDLDEAAPDVPVFISHTSGHLAYVNSRAMEIAGIGKGTRSPVGGRIYKSPCGTPTGLLEENAAIRMVTSKMSPYPEDRLETAMADSIAYFHRAGITSCHDAALGYFDEGPQILSLYRRLYAKGELDLRIYLTLVEELYRSFRWTGFEGIDPAVLRPGSVKLFQDGSIQALTAALGRGYHNAPGTRGCLIHSQERLNSLVEKYHQKGCQIAVHANGDRAISSVLTAVEAAVQNGTGHDRRHMIIHCQMAGKTHLKQMKALGCIPSYFVNHVYNWGDKHLDLFLGPGRAHAINPLKTSLDYGIPFTLHSDAPVSGVDPLVSIHNAVNRQTASGRLLGPGERIDAFSALKAYTTDAARCSFEEGLKGSIAPGKYADFVVLSHNPLKVPPGDIKNIRVLGTVVNGDTAFRA